MSKTAALLVAVALTLTACSSTPDKPTVAQGGEDFGKATELSNGFGTTAKPGEFPARSSTRWVRPSSKRSPNG